VNTLTLEDFHLASCQATLFTPDEEVSSVKLLKGLLPRWVERFDADPVSVPAVEGIPREVPRVTFRSTSGAWQCNIASARIDLFWRKPRTETPEPTLAQFFTEAVSLLNEYKEFLGARVGRMAAVLNRYALHPSPALFLARHFCQERWLAAPLNRPENLEFHAHKRFSLAGRVHVNSWVRSKSGRLSSGEENKPIILVEQDLNTPAEEAETRAFSKEDIDGFFSPVVTEFDVILRLYYPGEDSYAS
jgi:hypothetical protein